jgi:cyanophycinase
MKQLFLCLAVVLAAAGALAQAPRTSGDLILIGGGDKPDEAMRKFVELAGGPQSPIVVIPTASTERSTRKYYAKQFREELGCTAATVLDIRKREDAMRPDFVEAVASARGIFFGGGDQVRITTALLDTPVGKAIAEAFARGAVVGGTSAGTACQSGPMITGEGDFTVIRANAVELKPGFGFFRGVIVDQHFVARQRSNRLISVILEHPDLLGVGVDEDTAVWVRPDGTFRVIGKGSVMVIDPGGASIRRGVEAGGKDLLGVHDLRVHVLLDGEEYDPVKRAVIVRGGAGGERSGS